MFTQSIRSERGFTLIELLVVILIIGILAAIALPNFIGQRTRAQDVTAKSDARNAMTQVEACFTRTDEYSECLTLTSLGAGTGLKMGPNRGEIEIAPSGSNGFEISAKSMSGSVFKMTKATGTWALERTCTTEPGSENGGCPASGKW